MKRLRHRPLIATDDLTGYCGGPSIPGFSLQQCPLPNKEHMLTWKGNFSTRSMAVWSPFILCQVLRLCNSTEIGENKRFGKSSKAMDSIWIWKMEPNRGNLEKEEWGRQGRIQLFIQNQNFLKIQLEWIKFRPELKQWKLESLQSPLRSCRCRILGRIHRAR